MLSFINTTAYPITRSIKALSLMLAELPSYLRCLHRDALLTITNFVQEALDCGCEVGMAGLYFSAAFDHVNYKALIFEVRQLGIGGSILSTVSKLNFYQIDCRGLLLMVSLMIIEMLFCVYRREVYLALCFSYCIATHNMWFGLENMLVSYADDATLLARTPSPNMRSDITESLNRDLSKISTWCNLWGMRLNPYKTQSMIVSRSRTVFPPHPNLSVGSTSLNSCDSFQILGVMFDSKFTFERHKCSISSSVTQKIGLLTKSFRIFGDQDVLLRCINSFILPCLEYCSPVWSSAAESHLETP